MLVAKKRNIVYNNHNEGKKSMNAYNRKEEIINFCKEKYVTAFPKDIGFGNIVWLNVMCMARPYKKHGIGFVPTLRDIEYENAYKKLEHARKKIIKKFGKDEYKSRANELHKTYPMKHLTTEQLTLLGFDFNPYEHINPHKKTEENV